ncbi:MAG: GAF domain-containing protein [Deltaproteobacteria bacterium]|nr:GAF domain-containing protein [Deltaproteobacteria bacterium]
MRIPNPTSLRARLIELVLLAVLPALGLILYSAGEQRRLARSSAENEALRAVRVLAVSHERLIDSTRHLLITLSRLTEIRKGDSQACNIQFSELLKEYPLYTNLAVANLNGDLICSARALSKPVNVADRAYFQQALQRNDFAIGEYQIGRVSGKANLILAHPILNDTRKINGVVFAGLDLASFNQIVAAAQLPTTYNLTVVDRQGTILARHPNPEQWLGEPVPGSELFKNASGRDKGVAEGIGLDGKQQLYGFTSLEGFSREGNLHISIGIPVEIALSEANWMLKRNLAALILAGFLALAAAWFGSEIFVLRDLNAVVSTTEKIGAGDLSARTGLSPSRTEIGRLAASLDKMAEILEVQRTEAANARGEISALHSLTIAATQSLDLDVVLREGIQKVTEILHFDATRVFLFNADMSELQVRAAFEARPECWHEVVRFRRGESIVGRVADAGEPFIFEDIATDPRYLEMSSRKSSLKARARFLGMFPIKTKLKTWGAMVCVGQLPRKLDPAEINLLGSMTNQIGIAVENATLYQQTATKARELSALYSIAAIGSESLDINTVLHKTMHEVLHIFSFDAARIYVRQGDARELDLVAHAGMPEDISLIKKYAVGEGRLGKACETGEPMIVEDMQTDPVYNQTAHNKVMLRAGFRSSFLIPIKVRKEGLGVMNFLGKEPHKFSEADHQLINSIAYQLGIALGNANLFSQIKQKTVELEKANKGKDEFLGVISHELRTPLNVIKGYTELIQTEVFGDINPEQEKALEKIVNQTKELLSMINHVLQVTSIQAGAAKANRYDVNLCDLLDELKSNYVIPLKKEVAFNWNYSRDLPVIVSDDEKLKAVIQNLINNAVKFTEKGRISIFVRELVEAGAIELKVTDTGVGIPKEQLATIFEMFQQADSSTTRKHGGVGLGLYIVKTFAELLGGQVTVESELGKGSIFTVTLPTRTGVRESELQNHRKLITAFTT